MTEPHPMAALTRRMSNEQREKQTLLTIGEFFLWHWNDSDVRPWHYQHTMFHKCGVEGTHSIQLYNGQWRCRRCAEPPPDGLVAAYEFMNWEEKGYGG